MYERSNSTHYEAYKSLKKSARQLFISYKRFTDASGTAGQVLATCPVFDNHYSGWVKHFRTPINSGEGVGMKQGKIACFKMISELVGVRAMPEQFIHTEDAFKQSNSDKFGEESVELPEVADVVDPFIIINFSGRSLALSL